MRERDNSFMTAVWLEECTTDSKRGCLNYVSRVGSGSGKSWVVVLVGREHLLAGGREGEGGEEGRRKLHI